MHVTDWTFMYNYIPGRISDYFTIEKDGMEIDAQVLGWLDESLTPTRKSKASYIRGKRFSYHNKGRENHPEMFAIKI